MCIRSWVRMRVMSVFVRCRARICKGEAKSEIHETMKGQHLEVFSF